ncbi:MAG: RNA polymerase subunit sigma-24 [Acidobacteria bacterium]|nr:MAG: RNA polymerase subunit sigma-24 [Acidobacteriota bacterium]
MTTALYEPSIQKLVPVLPVSTASRQRQTPPVERSEAESIRLAQGGDAAAFEHIYRTHSRRVYGLCFRMTGNPTLAEDLTQEIFLQVFRKIQTFRAEAAFSTWLYRLAVNVVLMRRRVKTLNETSLEARNETEGDSFPRKEMARVDMRVSGVVDRVNLKRALSRLPRGYRQIFLLHDVLGYEHHEIAEALGCSVGNSKSQLHKARMRLRTILRNGSSTNPTFSPIGAR